LGEFGHDELVVLAYHPTSDPFGTPETQSRINWYGNPGYPTCFFDGYDSYVGSFLVYSRYKTRIQNHLQDPAPLSIDLYGSIGNNSGSVDAHIEVIDQLTEPDLEVMFVVYEDYAPTGGNEYRWVVRDILNSEPVTVSQPGETMDVSRTFSISGNWDASDISVVVFVQSTSSKLVMQASELSKIITTWTPQTPTVQRGTDLVMDVVIENITQWAHNADFWLDVELPNGEPYSGNPVMGPSNHTIPGNFNSTFTVSLPVPSNAPTWTYTLHGRVGVYPDDIWYTSSFEVTVVP